MLDSEWARSEPRRGFSDAVSVVLFAWSMWKKLRANRFKAHWAKNGDFLFFRQRIDDELLELENAWDDGSAKDVMLEAADVGNFAMMIHDRARRIHLVHDRALPAPDPGAKEEK